MALGDGRCDRQPAPPAVAPTASSARELLQGARQAGTLVDDLDPHAMPASRSRAQLDPAGRVLERVGDEVRDGLREAQAISLDLCPGRELAQQQVAVEHARDDPPARELLLEQLGDLDRLVAIERASAAARGGEVVQRQARAAQLEFEPRDPFGWSLAAALHRGEAEPRCGQRATQLVAGARDELAAAAQLPCEAERDGEHHERRQPAPLPHVSGPLCCLSWPRSSVVGTLAAQAPPQDLGRERQKFAPLPLAPRTLAASTATAGATAAWARFA